MSEVTFSNRLRNCLTTALRPSFLCRSYSLSDSCRAWATIVSCANASAEPSLASSSRRCSLNPNGLVKNAALGGTHAMRNERVEELIVEGEVTVLQKRTGSPEDSVKAARGRANQAAERKK